MKKSSRGILLIILSAFVLFTGCGTSRANRIQMDSVSTNALSQPTEDTQETDFGDIPEYYKEIFSLGSYDEIIRIGGKFGDSPKVDTSKKVIFPEGKIVTATTKTSGTREKFLDMPINIVKDMLSTIENKSVTIQKTIKSFDYLLGANLTLILLNTSGDYIPVHIQLGKNHNHQISVWDDKFSENDSTKHYFFYSPEFTKIIKKLSGWCKVSDDDFNDISSATCTTTASPRNGKEKTRVLSKKEIQIIIEAAKTKNKILEPLESSCPFDKFVELTTKDGTVIHISWANDSCGRIGIEGQMFTIKDSQLIEKVNKTLK